MTVMVLERGILTVVKINFLGIKIRSIQLHITEYSRLIVQSVKSRFAWGFPTRRRTDQDQFAVKGGTQTQAGMTHARKHKPEKHKLEKHKLEKHKLERNKLERHYLESISQNGTKATMGYKLERHKLEKHKLLQEDTSQKCINWNGT